MTPPRNFLPSRRQALIGGACGLVAGAIPVALHFAGRTAVAGSFHFAVVNDVHIIDHACADWLAGVFRQMQAGGTPVDFCLVLGDIAHNGTPDQLALARGAFNSLGAPVYPVIGNHDQNHSAGRDAYAELFPDRFNYHFEHKGWQFVGLDSTDGSRWEQPFPVGPETMQWVSSALPELDRGKPTVLFTHFPLGSDVWGRPTNAAELLGHFRGHSLSMVFSGHFHGHTSRWFEQIELATNHCCSLREPNHDSFPDKAYFLCRARPDGSVATRRVTVPPADA
jgi:3',5'-cyclic AMP phosphodiesterase CpdA